MTRDQMLIRAGFYMGMAGRLLNDNSYAARWHGRADEMTEADYMRETSEIQSRLVAGGFIAPDEDPYRTIYTYERLPCPGNDPTCPCQDGDMCHYRGPNPWPIPERR